MNEGVDVDSPFRVPSRGAKQVMAAVHWIGRSAALIVTFVSSCLVAPLPSPFALWFIILLLLG